jgi:hypothetical protein
MNRDPRWALQPGAGGQAKSRFFTDLLEGETTLLELIAALDASMVDD